MEKFTSSIAESKFEVQSNNTFGIERRRSRDVRTEFTALIAAFSNVKTTPHLIASVGSLLLVFRIATKLSTSSKRTNTTGKDFLLLAQSN